VDAAVFQNFYADGDMLFAAEVINTYSGYYPSADPKRHFTILLVDTDNTTILGAAPLPNWGDRPVSIYVNPTVAASLVETEAYYIKMVGTLISGTPTVTYQLTEDDWYGYDFDGAALDGWCIGVATNMQISDDRNDYLTVLTDQGVVISDEAGGYFATGIPGITEVRPNLFVTSKVTPKLSAGTANNAWDSLTAWETYVGATITADANAMALPFGITGKNFLAGVVMLVILGSVIFVGASTAGWGALGAVFIAVPILWLGTWWRILPIAILMVLLLFLAFMWIRQFFIKTL
jgi:hypothetical protein